MKLDNDKNKEARKWFKANIKDDEFCEHCGAKLNKDKVIFLIYDRESDKWFPMGEGPDKEDYECFPFGSACANKVYKTQTCDWQQ